MRNNNFAAQKGYKIKELIKVKKLITVLLVIMVVLTFAVGCKRTPNKNQNAGTNNSANNNTNNNANKNNNAAKTPGRINVMLDTDTEVYSVNVKHSGGTKTFKNEDMSAYKRGDMQTFELDRQYLGDMTIEVMDKEGKVIATKNFTGNYANRNDVTLNYRVVEDKDGKIDIIQE